MLINGGADVSYRRGSSRFREWASDASTCLTVRTKPTNVLNTIAVTLEPFLDLLRYKLPHDQIQALSDQRAIVGKDLNAPDELGDRMH
jgi:hypothetical protein